jgi:hypothetical protein
LTWDISRALSSHTFRSVVRAWSFYELHKKYFIIIRKYISKWRRLSIFFFHFSFTMNFFDLKIARKDLHFLSLVLLTSWCYEFWPGRVWIINFCAFLKLRNRITFYTVDDVNDFLIVLWRVTSDQISFSFHSFTQLFLCCFIKRSGLFGKIYKRRLYYYFQRICVGGSSFIYFWLSNS